MIVIEKYEVVKFIDGEFEHLKDLETNEDMFIYRKKYLDTSILVILNLGENEFEYDTNLLKDKEILISNYSNLANKLRAYEALIVKE